MVSIWLRQKILTFRIPKSRSEQSNGFLSGIYRNSEGLGVIPPA
jgi:hypothetical protein